MAQVLGGDVDEILRRGMTVLPVHRIARRVDKAFQLAHRLGKHGGVVNSVDDPVAPFVFFQKGWRQTEVAKTATTLPVDSLADTTLICAVDELLEARDDVGVAVLARIYPDNWAGEGISRSMEGSYGE